MRPIQINANPYLRFIRICPGEPGMYIDLCPLRHWTDGTRLQLCADDATAFGIALIFKALTKSAIEEAARLMEEDDAG